MPQESNHIHHNTITERGVSREDGVADSEDMRIGVYSVLSYGDKPQPQRHTWDSQTYAEVTGKERHTNYN